MKRFVLFLATGLGAGKLPWAPGSWGSLLGVLFAYALSFLPFLYALSVLILICGLSVWISHEAEKILGEKDASSIVIDEVCGMAVALFNLPFNLFTVLVAFGLFRFFDILKVPPANWLEKKCQGGVGIVFDDLMAGLYARFVMEILIRWF